MAAGSEVAALHGDCREPRGRPSTVLRMPDVAPSPRRGRRPHARAVLAAAVSCALLAPAAAHAQQEAPKADQARGAQSKNKAKKPERSVTGELTRLERARSITASQRGDYRQVYLSARAKARGLARGSTARRELEGVIANTEDVTRARKLDGSVAPSVFETLRVNRDWWGSRPNPAGGSRPVVPGSPLVWQYYGGEGLQIQWLATFGLANALSTTTTPAKAAQQRAILDEALRLASRRSGGPAWQYLFDFGGGAPPWGSAMAQSTGMQALVRGAARFGDDRYRRTAVDAVQLLRKRSPGGSLLKVDGGEHQLIYTFSSMRVLNAFAQTVSALREVAGATGDGRVAGAYVRAERQLRAELPRYDTGRWTRYSLGGRDATRGYHEFARDVVRGLCRNLTTDGAAFAEGQPVAGRRAPADPAIYCAASDRWTGYLRARTARSRVLPVDPVAGRDPAARLADPALGER